ncbi:MAG: nicotinate (nicotinamide) nucleotide adenylyltransferase [Deltaproteobacteria bacterium]|nr:nicotinate (nicotinamide) nucleotide adenylyltransferase [Deltaproteobacteria bacterium]
MVGTMPVRQRRPRSVAVFGGSFDPPHVGHVLAAAYVLSTAPVDALLVVPVFRHPFAKPLAPFEARMEMCRRAMGWMPRVEICAIERELRGTSRTLHTIEALRRREPQSSWRLVIGSDVLADLSKWHRYDRIAELAPPLVLGRVGHAAPGAPAALLPQVSSSEIRYRLARGERCEVERLCPRAVLELIDKLGLYGGAER